MAPVALLGNWEKEAKDFFERSYFEPIMQVIGRELPPEPADAGLG